QIKKFYEADEKVLWLTFYANKMWWCFSKPKIALLPDKSKTRPVIGKWHDTQIDEKTPLTIDTQRRSLKDSRLQRNNLRYQNPNHPYQNLKKTAKSLRR